jgi:5-formyltetrahydrofolate cyclo-ligase
VSAQSVGAAKQQIRSRVWNALEASGASSAGEVQGRIPDFVGAEEAAARLAGLGEWNGARVVKVVPDRPQRPVRRRALEAGKLVYLAVPRLATEEPFVELDPSRLTVSSEDASVPAVALEVGRPIAPEQMRPVDVVVLGSVAVNRRGQRIGKGAGYADLELALLADAGLLGDHTAVVTTVHDSQVLDAEWAEAPHDGRVDLIVTPTRTLVCSHERRRPTILWSELDDAYIEAIPVLARLCQAHGQRTR